MNSASQEIIRQEPLGLAAPSGTFFDHATLRILTTATPSRFQALYPAGRFAAGYWYRYHHLFAEALRERLRKQAPHRTVMALHGRASQWFEGRGLIAEAIDHGLAALD